MIWSFGRADGSVPFDPGGGLRFECPSCGHVVVFAESTVNRHLDLARDIPERDLREPPR